MLLEEAQETVSAQIASRDYPLIRWPHVLSAQHLLDMRRSLGFGFFSTCRECLTRRGSYPQRFRRLLSDSAPASQPSGLRLSHSSNASSQIGSSRSALHRGARRLLRPRLTSAHPSPRLSASLALRQMSRPPRVRRVTFLPHTRRIYAPSVRMASGFGSFCPLAHLQDASMRFVFLGPGVCLQLPSHPTSR